MKKLLLVLAVAFVVIPARSQFKDATLQATGLTCAMCSNAINKALQQVSFVESVKPDIKNSSFNVVFKSTETINIDALKDAVEDAGFAIGSLRLTTTFNDLKVEKDEHVKIGTANFHFLNMAGEMLTGDRSITIVDKNFVTEKQFKKYSSATKMSCMQTGKAGACCLKEGIGAGDRVYHVIL